MCAFKKIRTFKNMCVRDFQPICDVPDTSQFSRNLVEMFSPFSMSLRGHCDLKYLLQFLTNLWRHKDVAVSLKFIRNFFCNDVTVSSKLGRNVWPIFDVAVTSDIYRNFSTISGIALTSQFCRNLFIIFDQTVMSLRRHSFVEIHRNICQYSMLLWSSCDFKHLP